MRKHNLLNAFIQLLALILFSSTPSFAYFFDGYQLVDKLKDYDRANEKSVKTNHANTAAYSNYVSGIYDVYELNNTICAGIKVTPDQVNTVVAKFLKSNPERWDEAAGFLVRDALIQAFPCE